MTIIHSYKELIVWKKSILLIKLIYKITKKFPKSELYSLVDQIRRAAISIASNIAEGYGRRSHKEYLQFYSIAYGSALEVETQLIISKELGFITQKDFEEINNILTEVIKMLYVMVFRNS
jgi:four helix bundle protein